VSTERPAGLTNGTDTMGSSRWFTEIIRAINKPISFFVLVILAILILFFSSDDLIRYGLLALLVIIVALIGWLTAVHPGRLLQEAAPKGGDPDGAAQGPNNGATTGEAESAANDPREPPSDAPDSIRLRVQVLNAQIYGAQSKPPNLDRWYQDIHPTLHQAVFYTVPTYFLDRDLYVLDYNVAFEMIFSRAAKYLRGRHVNWFIAQLRNHDQVQKHGRQFTERVTHENTFPLIDLEPIVYDSPDFGPVSFTKIASQLNDRDGRLQGWAVALMLKQIAWEPFEARLGEKLRLDKLWSVYASSYDRILPDFPEYAKLIGDVLEVLPGGNLLVADLGAGTGNVTAALRDRGCRVVAIENNVGMLDRFRAKGLPTESVTIIKDSIEDCERLKEGIFDGVVMVNVLYAVDDPLNCLRQVHRLLKPGGVLGFSTTHRETRLDELLAAIKVHLEKSGAYDRLAKDYLALCKVNRDLELSIVRRHTREQYRDYTQVAGFEITRFVPSTYHNAVMILHARKP
jgi:SAM-dependent methyltransferase